MSQNRSANFQMIGHLSDDIVLRVLNYLYLSDIVPFSKLKDMHVDPRKAQRQVDAEYDLLS